MEEKSQLELIIASDDEQVVRDIEQSLGGVEVVRDDRYRALDALTVLAVAAAAVKLVNELLTLKEKLSGRANPPRITLRNVDGDAVELMTATAEQLQELIS